MMRVSLTSALAVGSMLLAGCSGTAAPTAAEARTGIEAHGEATVTGTPDTLTLVLGVQTQAPSARSALGTNSVAASALIGVLKGRGVAAKDLRTSELSINPIYGSGPGQIVGYQVVNQVTATVHDIASAGGIIDAAAATAGNAVRVQQVSFSIADDSALLARARAAAVHQAMARAKQLADAAGVSLGAPRSISESSSNPLTPYKSQLAPRAVPGADVPVEPGSQELQASVDVVYDIAS